MHDPTYQEGDIHRRYERARKLSRAMVALWLERLAAHVPPVEVRTIVDLGCGTGRFTAPLARHFSARVYGIDPSPKMLMVAREALAGDDEADVAARVELLTGSAEEIPLASETADLLFLSMVFHHIADRERAFSEFRRVLAPRGRLSVRTATRERMDSFLWLDFFPEARAVELRRTPARDALRTLVEAHGFRLEAHEVVRQVIAEDPAEYHARLGERAISSLRAIADAAFARGLAALGEYCAAHSGAGPVYEEIDLFVFRLD